MVEVPLDHVDVVRGLFADGTELVVKALPEHITITYHDSNAKPVQTVTIFRSPKK
jgi:hypothetical protein